MEAIGSKQGQRSDLTGEARRDAAKELAEQASDSKRNIFRYMRLNNLIPELLQRVDEKSISVEAGGSLSTLRPQEQERLETILKEREIKRVTPKQAETLSTRSGRGELSEYDIECCLDLHKEKPLTLNLKLTVQDLISEDDCKQMQTQLRKRGKDKDFVQSLLEVLRRELNG